MQAIFISGCGTANNDAPSLNASGKHPDGWFAFNGGNHRLVFRTEPGQCPQCHGSDLFQQGSKGGVARVSCSSTSFNGIICHANAHVPRLVPHVLPFTNPALHGQAAKQDLVFCMGCHASSSGGAGSNPRFNAKIGALINGCEDCHNIYTAHPSAPAPDSAPWRGSFTHQDAKNLDTACALCHGVNLDGIGAVGPACSACHTAASPLTAKNCTSCHLSKTVSDQFNSYFSGRHDFHVAIFLNCKDCHDTVKLATGHFVNIETPEFEQLPASTIRDVVNYVGGSCSPANTGTNFSLTVCHVTPEMRSWTAP